MCDREPCRDPEAPHGEWSHDGRSFRECGHFGEGWCACTPRLCIRWGIGPDRCILPFDHVGPDRDAQGRDTLGMAAEVLGRTR